MIKTIRTRKDGKRIITSSYFDDIRMLRKSKSDTFATFSRFDKDALEFDRSGWQLSMVAMEIALWRRGCQELTSYVNSLKPAQVEMIAETRYMGADVDWEIDEKKNS